MVELFNNEKNKDLVFNVDTQGMEKSKLEVRMLVMTNESSKNMFFISEVVDGKVSFSLPALNDLSESQQGKLRLEVVADGEYFKPWESDFEVKTKRILKVTTPVTESIASSKKILAELDSPVEKPIKDAPKKSVSEKTATVLPKVVKPAQVLQKAVPVPKLEKKVVQTLKDVVEPVKEQETLTFEDFLNKRK